MIIIPVEVARIFSKKSEICIGRKDVEMVS